MSVSEAESSCEPTPKNIYWLETFVFPCPCDFTAMADGDFYETQRFSISFLDDSFGFRIERTNTAELTFYIDREESKTVKPDPGYVIRFYCTPIGVRRPRRYVDLHYNESSTSIVFLLEGFLEKLLQLGSRLYIWYFKVVAKMIEFTSLQGERYDACERLTVGMKHKFFKSERQHKDMLSILKRPEMTDMFTGRQGNNFVAVKLNLIARTAPYSKEISQFMKSFDEGNVTPPLPNFRVLLNRIVFEEDGPIELAYVPVVYLTSMAFEMSYLKVMATYCIEENLQDLNFLVEVLKATNRTDDFHLFNKAADVFVARRSEVMETQNWKALVENLPLASSVLHSIKYRLTVEELYIPPSLEQSTSE